MASFFYHDQPVTLWINMHEYLLFMLDKVMWVLNPNPSKHNRSSILLWADKSDVLEDLLESIVILNLMIFVLKMCFWKWRALGLWSQKAIKSSTATCISQQAISNLGTRFGGVLQTRETSVVSKRQEGNFYCKVWSTENKLLQSICSSHIGGFNTKYSFLILNYMKVAAFISFLPSGFHLLLCQWFHERIMRPVLQNLWALKNSCMVVDTWQEITGVWWNKIMYWWWNL